MQEGVRNRNVTRGSSVVHSPHYVVRQEAKVTSSSLSCRKVWNDFLLLQV